MNYELCANGAEVPVTTENLIRYIHLFANFRLNIEISEQCRAFLNGFRDLIPTEWIRMFNPVNRIVDQSAFHKMLMSA